jgi:acyl-CoA thioesterase
MSGRYQGVHVMTEATPAVADPTARMFAADRASRLLGIELLEHGEGTAVLRMTVTASMVSGHGTAHEVAIPQALGLARAGGTATGRSGVYDVSVVRGRTVIAEFRGRSRSVRSTESGEPQ